ncbi:bifunctional aspartate transaminase/aspartate 4-decarboxylase [Actinocorallia sp. A-T 12471]|uniref:bifunctional aspartate transaminase/aspartate 4-decarboxylase n=1 Tax=Actinocorallia sp. A-T 12471 TaxID=3089813 RepID=UPI0029D2F998|nr:bifunctional aspartate transaminase/aspartate 4-decarboxylase [Actinocorallia sp. A-T 12471]MDX6742256.1 bifunctional aspartate transaminase/aspartate 4-decarboxylase [Actinocorallia sp. A-T 12471]
MGGTKDSVGRATQRRLEGLSPFELKDTLIGMAEENQRKSAAAMLNAGRGNPNWIATTPREAFLLLGRFAIDESRRTWHEWDDLAGMPGRDGIADRFTAFLDKHPDEPGATLLRNSIAYGTGTLGFDPDAFVHELADGFIGDNYPVPVRMLDHFEQIAHAYLVKEMCAGQAPEQPFDLFATEGGTAAMCYIFESAIINRILHPGDRIALMVPIFTPYLEIPRLAEFGFDAVEIKATKRTADGLHLWEYGDDELDKLRDPSIKALFLVNPSNPPSVMLPQAARERIAGIVREHNPGLAIITDDVYGTFVNGFESLMSTLPRNTLGVYSFSKYFGATGWRLGVIAVNRDNVFDAKLAALPDADKQALAKRYAPITLEPEKLRFVDRLVADSRMVALNHTAGLSLPQQTQMTLFALAGLLDADDVYKKRCQGVISRRLDGLTAGLTVHPPKDPYAAHYYVELDVLVWAEKQHGKEFADWLVDSYEPVDILFRLAENHSVVLLPGGGFDGPQWSLRVSLANLPLDAYRHIGAWLAEAGLVYKAEFDKREQR